MFAEEICKVTADQLRSHIGGYLAEIDSEFTGTEIVQLSVPKTIDVAAVVGGVIQELPSKTPAYAVDCLGYSFAGIAEDLYIYAYEGHISGLVAAGDEMTVNRMVKRHAKAVFKFIHNHLYLHNDTTYSSKFRILGFEFADTAFSGSEMVDDSNNRQIWLAGFRHNILWTLSQDGQSQHG
jgi:hypothetical protein